jgi:hypothetical protein
MRKILSVSLAAALLATSAVATTASAEPRRHHGDRDRFVSRYCDDHRGDRDCRDYRRNRHSWNDDRYDRWSRHHRLPTGAFGGRRDLMRRVAPAGPVYQAGTLSGNPLAVAAGRAALAELAEDGGAAYGRLEEAGARLAAGLAEAAARHGVPLQVPRQGSMLGLFFTDRPVRRLEDVTASDRALFARVFHRLLAHGVHLPPSPYEALFVSTAHGDAEVDFVVEAFDRALGEALGESVLVEGVGRRGAERGGGAVVGRPAGAAAARARGRRAVRGESGGARLRADRTSPVGISRWTAGMCGPRAPRARAAAAPAPFHAPNRGGGEKKSYRLRVITVTRRRTARGASPA